MGYYTTRFSLEARGILLKCEKYEEFSAYVVAGLLLTVDSVVGLLVISKIRSVISRTQRSIVDRSSVIKTELKISYLCCLTMIFHFNANHCQI